MIGASADIIVAPEISLIIGFCGGTISTIGFNYFPEILYEKLGLHDTCGVMYLHCIPGILGGIISGLITATTNPEFFGNDLNSVFPKLGPDSSRTMGVQAGYQIAGVATTIAFAALSGSLTGLVMRIPYIWNTPKWFYSDRSHWEFSGGDHDERLEIDEDDEKKNSKEERIESAEDENAPMSKKIKPTTDSDNSSNGYVNGDKSTIPLTTNNYI